MHLGSAIPQISGNQGSMAFGKGVPSSNTTEANRYSQFLREHQPK
jgi:hypothetical protein